MWAAAPTDGSTDLSLNDASPLLLFPSPIVIIIAEISSCGNAVLNAATRDRDRSADNSPSSPSPPLRPSSATATAATGQRRRGSSAAELRTDGVEGRENQFYVLLPFAVTDIDDRGRKFATFCPRERFNAKSHLHLRKISCQGKEKKQGKHSPNDQNFR